MKKKIILCVCAALCLYLTACVGPGTGPYGTYTAADHYRDTVNTAAAVGAIAIGASILGNSYHHGRYYHRRAYSPYVYRPPVVHYGPRVYIYR
jgi:hypothetical protein